jgi:hypothetical protein
VDPIIIVTPVTRLWILKRVDSFALFDTIPIASTMETRYGNQDLSTHLLQRHRKTLAPAYTYDPHEWIAYDADTTLASFALSEPMVTPLEQDKAWATYVMFGAGMLAAGRVEEAFRELEEEFIAMASSNKQLIFSEPNTTVTGINENNREDRSTFREAVGRFNYLAARVSGAVGLTMPPSNDLQWLTIVYGLLALLGFTSLTILIKQRKQRQ